MPRAAMITEDRLTDALVRVVALQGLDAVSIRAVAREAGVSLGAVQYHFATKDELLIAAYRRVVDGVTARAHALVAQDVEPAAFVRGLLLELLPLDSAREAEVRVGLAFSARAMHHPALTALYTEGYRALVAGVAGGLRAAGFGADPEPAAQRAVALADGLAWHLLCAPSAVTPDDAIAAVDAHVAQLLDRP